MSGGLSLGFEKCGFDVVLANEYDPSIAASEAISVAAAFMENDVCCGNCKYHVHDDNGDGMCVNADSDACADWTDDSDICGNWAEKGEVTKL